MDEKQEVIIEPIERDEPPRELMVIARSAAEMEVARGKLIEWAVRHEAIARLDHDDAFRNLEIAIKSGWRKAPFVNAEREAKNKVVYYEKLRAAFEAGYTVVPNMPIDVFAVRTSKSSTPTAWKVIHTHRDWPEAQTNSPSVGEGRYVDRRYDGYIETRRALASGSQLEVRPRNFRDAEFPIVIAKPLVLESVSRAMQEKIFDEIGILPARNQQWTPPAQATRVDPMVIGTIVFRRSPDSIPRRVSFVVAWWLAEEHLKV